MLEDRLQLEAQFEDFLLLEKGMSQNSAQSYCTDVKLFLEFLDHRHFSLTNFSEDNVRDYLEERSSQGIASHSVQRYMSALSAYVAFLRADDRRTDNPMMAIDRPKGARHLPKVMSEEAVNLFLEAPDLSTYVGMRDKAMFELLYACGLRVSELCNLKFEDLHLQDCYIIIRGKGDKQRLIPINDEAVYWIRRYVQERRFEKDSTGLSQYVFLSTKTTVGAPLTRIAFWYRVKSYARQIGLEKEPSPHTFRHAFATHLLNHDADLRSLQELLGHASLSTTQIYTHVALARMHEVYDKAHPHA